MLRCRYSAERLLLYRPVKTKVQNGRDCQVRRQAREPGAAIYVNNVSRSSARKV